MPAGQPSPGRLEWVGEEELTVAGTKLHILPDEKFGTGLDLGDSELLVAKPRRLIDRYVELVAELQPERIFELGVFHGGSTVLLAGLAQPRRLVAIDRENAMKRLHDYIAERGDDVVRAYGGVDQSDRPRLAEIYASEFGDEPLDLVIDDCSHFYEPTLASFNELFPRLRPGGLYVIEDWPWAHNAAGTEISGGEGFYPDRLPLTRLVFELLLAIPSLPGLITEISVDLGSVILRRGDAEVSAQGFDVTAELSPRGRELLAPL